MEFLKLLLIFLLLTILPGQLLRIPLSQQATVTLSDFASFLLACTFTTHSLLIKKSLKINKNLSISFLIFSLLAAASTIFATQNFTRSEILTSLLFLFRFSLYFYLFIVVSNTISKADVNKWLNLIIFVCLLFSVVGFFQFIFFPDLTFLAAYGWDPHQKRVVSSLLDPNFSGGLLTIAFSISTALFLKLKNKLYLLFSIILFAGIILTFSRSSYLALLTAISVIGLLKSPKILLAFLIAAVISFLLIAQVRNRVVGAFTFDQTAQARVESWQKAGVIFKDNLAFGVGFNTYRFAQAEYGFFSTDQPQGGHSGAGTDSSILLVAATTGIIGVLAYLVFLINIGKTFAKNLNSNALSLGAIAAFLGLLVHSQFVNSLFFPQIMLSLFFLLGLASSYDN